jgi:hypothetical protein
LLYGISLFFPFATNDWAEDDVEDGETVVFNDQGVMQWRLED